MERRELLKTASLAAIGGTILSRKSLASEKKNAENALLLEKEITRNHGHEFRDMTIEEIILLIREIEENGPKTLDIQGGSSHPHSIEVSREDLFDLIVGNEVRLESSVDFGHTHVVILKLSQTKGEK